MTTPLHLRQSERQFQQAVMEYAQARGWMVMHIRPARTGRTRTNKQGEEREVWDTPYEGDPGFPDLVLVRSGRVWLFELKSERGAVTNAQEKWLNAAEGHGAVLRPSDWPQIEEVLK